MTSTRFLSLLLVAVLCVGLAPAGGCASEGATRQGAALDPLPSWNEGATKRAIIGFVERVTRRGGADYVPPAQRIAVFDNDGTLWAEHPEYVQVVFMMDRVRELAPQHPEWQALEPFKSLMAGDSSTLFKPTENFSEAWTATHAGMGAEEFDRISREWIRSARHPARGRLYSELVYQPMLELLDYLRASGFKTFIVSGGDTEFMRAWAEEVYGIPPEQVIGSSLVAEYQSNDGRPVMQRRAEVEFVALDERKAVAIYRCIGRRPIAAFGNSDGDFEMLEWTTSGPGPRLGVLVHHTDAAREEKYDRGSRVGRLERGLDEAPQRGWIMVDMARDWKEVFSQLPGPGSRR